MDACDKDTPCRYNQHLFWLHNEALDKIQAYYRFTPACLLSTLSNLARDSLLRKCIFVFVTAACLAHAAWHHPATVSDDDSAERSYDAGARVAIILTDERGENYYLLEQSKNGTS